MPFSQPHNSCDPERSEASAVRRQRLGIRCERYAASFLTAILIAQGLNAQEKKPWTVDRICGRVEYLQRVPIRKQPNIYSDKRMDLRGIPLELYESPEGAPCCEALKNVGSTISGKVGQFEFEAEKAGHYWLTAKWNGKDYKVAVEFEPQKKSSTVCSQQGIQMEDGEDASWWVTVTVD